MCQRQVSFVQARSGGHYEPVSDSSNGELGLYLNPKERNSQDSCADMCASSFLTEKTVTATRWKVARNRSSRRDLTQIIFGAVDFVIGRVHILQTD